MVQTNFIYQSRIRTRTKISGYKSTNKNQNSLNALEDYLFSHRETIPEKTQEIEDRLMNYGIN